MFEFLEAIADISLFGMDFKYPRLALFITAIMLIGVIIAVMIYVGDSGGSDASHSAVESEIKLIDKAIAKFYKEQFTLPADVEQLIDFAYIEKDKKVWKNWEFSLEGDARSITGIMAVSTEDPKETIRFDCIDKMFDD
ncbi:MAG: hypothetical protein HN356_04340 [Calditrichaeota bacterium]|jgi:hypothetical protein|nr:hypothetical protein [Calditrichota bacterium]MBT7617370.1 hypothetical protein [Calditrichota bacterium]MBT7790414.1 hypothetical protein [Calditrichota bacterium]